MHLIPEGHKALRFSEAARFLSNYTGGAVLKPRTLARHAGRGWLPYVVIGTIRYTSDVWAREYLDRMHQRHQPGEPVERMQADIDRAEESIARRSARYAGEPRGGAA
jgi:hypothetical protein